ncbi:MAG: BamA/TamA family outer membrane protein, partial [Chlamydiia bacterium]|nr:BamA/TamA family outer membrane protein [Chlamydiia bacterium]
GTHLRVKNSEVDVKGNADGMTEQIKDEVTIDGLVCASGVSLIYDSTDRPICPREGLRSRLAAELGTRKFSSLFLGLSYTNTWYYPLCNDGVFRFRADHRFILPCLNMKYSTVPIDERIFLGGDNTIRGYRPYKVGEVFDNSVIPRGGLSMMLYSAEYNHAIFEILDGFLFVDGGYISKHKLNIGSVKFSAGFGIRLKILGQGVPITFGYGFPLNPSNNSEVKRFFWSMGGRF